MVLLKKYWRNVSMYKIRLLTHIADPDGAFPVILSKLVFQNLEYDLLQVDEVDDKVKEILPIIEQYDYVYIVDLNISKELAQTIEQNEIYKQKIRVIDHHFGKMDMNQFSFIEVVDIDEIGIKQSGTSLYLKNLTQNFDTPILHKPCIQTLVDYIRRIDTWTWQELPEAKGISSLFNIFGVDYFIEHYYTYVKEHDTFSYDDKDLYLLEVENIQIQNYINKVKDDIIPVKVDGYYVGVLFSDRYTSDVGNALAEMYKDTYDFIAMIKLRTKNISYRAVKDNIDLTVFTQKYGGNGHKHAAGSPIPDMVPTNIIHEIFPGSEVL